MSHVEVTQEARKAAVDLIKDQKPLYSDPDYLDDILSGDDDNNGIVQAFARFEKDIRERTDQQQAMINLVHSLHHHKIIHNTISSSSNNITSADDLTFKHVAICILEENQMINRAWYNIMIKCMVDYALFVSGKSDMPIGIGENDDNTL